MLGFRSVAVHDYQRLNSKIVRMIAEKHRDDFRRYAAAAISAAS